MREFFIPVVLQLAGVLIIIAEIILPSGGLLSLVAVGLFGYSLFIVFHDISTMAGTYFVLADLIIIPALLALGLKILARSPATLRETLSSESGVAAMATSGQFCAYMALQRQGEVSTGDWLRPKAHPRQVSQGLHHPLSL